MMMMRFSWLAMAAVFFIAPGVYAACPTGFTCQGLAGVINGASPIPATPGSTDRVPYVQGSTTYYLPGPQVLNGPTAANLTALRAACTALSGSCPGGDPYFPNGVWLQTNSVSGQPPLFYLPGNAACGIDDGYTCVDSADSKEWLLQIAPPPSVVTSSGAIALASQQTTFLWQPSAPSNSTVTLPATPLVGEEHVFKMQTSSPVYLEIAGNTGQTVDGNAYWVLAIQNDSVDLKWTGTGSSGNWAVVR